MRSFARALLAVLAVFPQTICLAQGTLQITFDGSPFIPPQSDIGVTQYLEQGMWFRPLGPSDPGNQFGRSGGGISFCPADGSAYISTALGDSMGFGFEGGSHFALSSVDLAEYSTVVPDAVTVFFVGHRADGSTVSTSFTTDGIIDGTGPLQDFQTFNFGPAWTDLTRVEIPGFGWSLDNLVVSVPEPGIGTLYAFGAISFWRCRRRKSK